MREVGPYSQAQVISPDGDQSNEEDAMYTIISAALADEHRNALFNEAAEARQVRQVRQVPPVRPPGLDRSARLASDPAGPARPLHFVSYVLGWRTGHRTRLASAFRSWLAAGQL
jgi:hypothetical protein